jgi:hypothetical protein
MPRQATIACSHRMTLVPSVLSITMGDDRSRYFAVKPAPACAPSGDDQRRPPPPHAGQAAWLVRRRPANGRRSVGIYVSRCGCQALPLDLPHVRSADTRERGTGCLRGGHAATSSCGGGRASSDGRWRFLRCFRRGVLAGGFFDRFCIHVQMVWNRPLTMATATALIPVMRAAATMGSSNLMGTSTTPGQATTSRVPASHAPCLILSLIGAFSGKPSGLFHRQTRCPGSRHRKSTSRARPAYPSSCPPGMAPGTAWPPASAGLLSMPPGHRRCPRTPRQTTPSRRTGRIVTRRRPPKDWAGHESNRGPGGNEVLVGDADLPHDLLDARDGRPG